MLENEDIAELGLSTVDSKKFTAMLGKVNFALMIYHLETVDNKSARYFEIDKRSTYFG